MDSTYPRFTIVNQESWMMSISAMWVTHRGWISTIGRLGSNTWLIGRCHLVSVMNIGLPFYTYCKSSCVLIQSEKLQNTKFRDPGETSNSRFERRTCITPCLRTSTQRICSGLVSINSWKLTLGCCFSAQFAETHGSDWFASVSRRAR